MIIPSMHSRFSLCCAFVSMVFMTALAPMCHGMKPSSSGWKGYKLDEISLPPRKQRDPALDWQPDWKEDEDGRVYAVVPEDITRVLWPYPRKPFVVVHTTDHFAWLTMPEVATEHENQATSESSVSKDSVPFASTEDGDGTGEARSLREYRASMDERFRRLISEGHKPDRNVVSRQLEKASAFDWSPDFQEDPATGRVFAKVPEEVMRRICPTPFQPRLVLTAAHDVAMLDLRAPDGGKSLSAACSRKRHCYDLRKRSFSTGSASSSSNGGQVNVRTKERKLVHARGSRRNGR